MNKTLIKGSKFLIFACSSLLFIFLLSCAKPKPVLEPEVAPTIAPKFEYTPVKEEPERTATIALISPEVSFNVEGIEKIMYPELEPIIKEYLASLDSDFNETLVAKGYSISGPFKNLEVMTYPQKERAILGLTPKITITCRFNDNPDYTQFSERVAGGEDRIAKSDGEEHYFTRVEEILEFNGQLTVSGIIELTLVEPISKEKMWIKQIEIDPEEVQTYKYYMKKSRYEFRKYFVVVEETQPGEMKILRNSDFRPNAFAKILESGYVSQLDQFSKYFHPREIAQVIKDAEKLRKK